MGRARLALSAAAFAFTVAVPSTALAAASPAGASAGAPVLVAVVDTGVAADHPALAGRVVSGWNFVAGDTDTSDDNGHGTAVAGIVTAAEASSGIPNACAQCRILAVKALAANGTADWDTVSAAVKWAADHGANVINLSLGSAHVPGSIADAVSYALSKGVIVVAAAGNEGQDEAYYPADFPGVVSVAGIDGSGYRYPWSNFGSRVTVAAPGCTVAAWLAGQSLPNFCGTSAAAPYVAGLAALAVSYHPGLSPQAFADALAKSGAPLPDGGIASDGLANPAGLLTALGVPASPPQAARAPVVAGVPRVGRRVVPTVGDWRDASSLFFQWQRSRDGRAWHGVSSGRVYVPQRADRGYRLRLVVSAANVRGAATAVSAPTARVEGGKTAHRATRVPTSVRNGKERRQAPVRRSAHARSRRR